MDPLLKTRLVGASVVILMAVIFLPMLLKTKPEPVSRVGIEVPDSSGYQLDKPNDGLSEEPGGGELSVEDRLASLSEQFPSIVEPAEVEEIPSRAVVEADSSRVEAPATIEPAPVPEPATSSLSVPEPVSVPDAAADGNFSVQVGSFVERNRADVLKDKLESAGFPGFVESDVVNGRNTYRVKAGPVGSREEGESLLKLMQSEGLVSQGFIVSER